MARYFLYGTLCHPPLLAQVLGRPAPALRPATVPGRVIVHASGHDFAVLVASEEGKAPGVVVEGLDADDVARLAYYVEGHGFSAAEVALEDGSRAIAFLPSPGSPGGKEAWDLEIWRGSCADVIVEAASEVMAQFGQRPAAEVIGRYRQILVRAASTLRARAGPAPASLRRPWARYDVSVETCETGYARFFAVEDYRLRHRRFDGAFSPLVGRAAFVSGDAATVLPYDPARDRVMLIEQFRMGPFAHGSPNPWLLEAIAGRVDPFETPEGCARREAVEEAGVALDELHHVASYYPSPGAKTEFIHSYVGIADLPDTVAGLGGVASEAEDIRSHLVPLDALLALALGREGANAPLLITAMWLQVHRDRLRTTA